VAAPRLLLLALVGAALPLSGYFAVVRPERARAIAAAGQRQAAREAEVQALEAIGARFPEWKRQEQSLRERMALLDEIRPTEARTGPLVERLRALAAAEGLTGVAVEPLVADANGETVPLRVSAEGAQAPIASLLGRLTSTSRLLRLDRVELERRDKGRYALVVRLVAFRDRSES
jgi:Tfp pilus assembly protein PilO